MWCCYKLLLQQGKKLICSYYIWYWDSIHQSVMCEQIQTTSKSSTLTSFHYTCLKIINPNFFTKSRCLMFCILHHTIKLHDKKRNNWHVEAQGNVTFQAFTTMLFGSSSFLGCDTMLLGAQLLPFQRTVVI